MAQVDADVVAKPLAQRLRLALRDRHQRRALVGPDLAIGVRRLRRAGAEDDAVQDRLPREAGNLDDARIGQEFGEVAAHRAALRRIGRAEIDQQHADARIGCRAAAHAAAHRVERQIAQALAGAGGDRVGDGRGKHGHAEPADAARRARRSG